MGIGWLLAGLTLLLKAWHVVQAVPGGLVHDAGKGEKGEKDEKGGQVLLAKFPDKFNELLKSRLDNNKVDLSKAFADYMNLAYPLKKVDSSKVLADYMKDDVYDKDFGYDFEMTELPNHQTLWHEMPIIPPSSALQELLSLGYDVAGMDRVDSFEKLLAFGFAAQVALYFAELHEGVKIKLKDDKETATVWELDFGSDSTPNMKASLREMALSTSYPTEDTICEKYAKERFGTDETERQQIYRDCIVKSRLTNDILVWQRASLNIEMKTLQGVIAFKENNFGDLAEDKMWDFRRATNSHFGGADYFKTSFHYDPSNYAPFRFSITFYAVPKTYETLNGNAMLAKKRGVGNRLVADDGYHHLIIAKFTDEFNELLKSRLANNKVDLSKAFADCMNLIYPWEDYAINPAAAFDATKLPDDMKGRELPNHETLLKEMPIIAPRSDFQKLLSSQGASDVPKTFERLLQFGFAAQVALYFAELHEGVKIELKDDAKGATVWELYFGSDNTSKMETAFRKRPFLIKDTDLFCKTYANWRNPRRKFWDMIRNDCLAKSWLPYASLLWQRSRVGIYIENIKGDEIDSSHILLPNNLGDVDVAKKKKTLKKLQKVGEETESLLGPEFSDVKYFVTNFRFSSLLKDLSFGYFGFKVYVYDPETDMTTKVNDMLAKKKGANKRSRRRHKSKKARKGAKTKKAAKAKKGGKGGKATKGGKF